MKDVGLSLGESLFPLSIAFVAPMCTARDSKQTNQPLFNKENATSIILPTTTSPISPLYLKWDIDKFSSVSERW